MTLPRAEADDARAAPDLSGKAILIVAPGADRGAADRAAARPLGCARPASSPTTAAARAVLPERHWDALLIDHALGLEAATALLREAGNVPRRIVLVTPAERHELAALRQAGFTGYLVKPVRAASLAARFRGDDLGMRCRRRRAKAREPRGAGLAILVAEDNEINALLARALLHRLGHRPTVAPNGAAAVEAFLAPRAPARLTISC